MARLARRIRVTGLVQGVFFRAWTKEQADQLGLTGWVRNCPDRSVEAHLEGDEQAVNQLIARMRHGPPGANVTGLVEDRANPTGVRRFDVRH